MLLILNLEVVDGAISVCTCTIANGGETIFKIVQFFDVFVLCFKKDICLYSLSTWCVGLRYLGYF